jgi:hypothetical protein
MNKVFSYGKLLSCIALIFFTSCTTIPKLQVTYKTTSKSDILQGKELYFKCIDKRSDKDIIGRGAKGAVNLQPLFREYGHSTGS